MFEILISMFPSSVVFKRSEPLSRHCAFRTGGEAALAAFPETVPELTGIADAAREKNVPFVIIGRGSNVIFDDSGYGGLVIFTERIKSVTADGLLIHADAGASLASVSAAALGASLGGLEFLSGIPGSVGGALYMNAGAFGADIAGILEDYTYYSQSDKRVINETRDSYKPGNRQSRFTGSRDIILSVSLRGEKTDRETIKGLISGFSEKRRLSQPLEYPSAGSVFRHPAKGVYAGKLIEDSGLKGYRIGGAEVSEKHAGFIVNRGNASSSDILSLIGFVTERVFENSGYRLETEVIHIKNPEIYRN